MSYENRRDAVASRTDFSFLAGTVGRWLKDRPAVATHDKNLSIMATKLIPGEVDEVEVEAMKRGTKSYAARAERTELGDAAFFALASLHAHGLTVDPYQVRAKLNGRSSQSSIHHRMREVGGNINPASQHRDLHYFLTLTLQYMADMPKPFSLEATMVEIIDKNSLNYLSWAFNGIHPVTGKNLNPEELNLQYDHARMCLKYIRNMMVNVLGHKDREYGLRMEDWLPYMRDIQNFPDSTNAFLALQIDFRLRHGLNSNGFTDLKRLKQ